MGRRKSLIPKVMITTTISVEDYKWCEQNGLYFNRLLESAIAIHRNSVEQGIKEDYYTFLKRKIEILQSRLQKINDFLEKKGLIDDFMKDEQ